MLQVWGDVAEKDDGGFLVFRWQCRSEMFEDVQSDRSRLASVQIPHVFTRPAKGLARSDFQSGEIDIAPLEEFYVLAGKILSDNPHQVHRTVEAGGDRSIRSRASQHFAVLLERGLDIIEGDRTDN